MKENSFKNSPYPVSLSIEMHCSPKQQKIMAAYFKDILQDLYVIDQETASEHMPSPEDLKYKFIIKEGKHRIFKPSLILNENNIPHSITITEEDKFNQLMGSKLLVENYLQTNEDMSIIIIFN